MARWSTKSSECKQTRRLDQIIEVAERATPQDWSATRWHGSPDAEHAYGAIRDYEEPPSWWGAPQWVTSNLERLTLFYEVSGVDLLSLR